MPSVIIGVFASIPEREGIHFQTLRPNRPVRLYTPTITSDALITAVACIPGFKPSSSAASLVMEAVINTVGETSIVTWVVVAPGFTVLMVPAIWLRAESFMRIAPLQGQRGLPGQTRFNARRCL